MKVDSYTSETAFSLWREPQMDRQGIMFTNDEMNILDITGLICNWMQQKHTHVYNDQGWF